jgi:hypothetical protein
MLQAYTEAADCLPFTIVFHVVKKNRYSQNLPMLLREILWHVHVLKHWETSVFKVIFQNNDLEEGAFA